jgi:hypothetical protein
LPLSHNINPGFSSNVLPCRQHTYSCSNKIDKIPFVKRLIIKTRIEEVMPKNSNTLNVATVFFSTTNKPWEVEKFS